VIKRCSMAICLAALAVSTVSAQKKETVAPPPKPANKGPSLEVTMKFIQDKLRERGKTNYTLNVHDSSDNKEWSVHPGDEFSNVVADPASCRISYHVHGWNSGDLDQRIVDVSSDYGFSLKDVQDVVVAPIELEGKLEGDTSTLSCKSDPPVFVLLLRREKGTFDPINFFDEDIANRVAKAMVHAVELCGGGSSPEPF
jgi:hypothetical protein